MKICDRCQHNEARYVDAIGQWLCGLCDLESLWVSVRVSDLAILLRAIDGLMRGSNSVWYSNEIERIICRKIKI